MVWGKDDSSVNVGCRAGSTEDDKSASGFVTADVRCGVAVRAPEDDTTTVDAPGLAAADNQRANVFPYDQSRTRRLQV